MGIWVIYLTNWLLIYKPSYWYIHRGSQLVSWGISPFSYLVSVFHRLPSRLSFIFVFDHLGISLSTTLPFSYLSPSFPFSSHPPWVFPNLVYSLTFSPFSPFLLLFLLLRQPRHERLPLSWTRSEASILYLLILRRQLPTHRPRHRSSSSSSSTLMKRFNLIPIHLHYHLSLRHYLPHCQPVPLVIIANNFIIRIQMIIIMMIILTIILTILMMMIIMMMIMIIILMKLMW